MRIQLTSFNGEIPKVHPTMLPQGASQRAVDTDHSHGTIRPLHQDVAAHDASPDEPEDFYLHKGTWLTFDDKVDVAPGPVAEDRLYIAQRNGDPILKVMPAGTEYPLALPTPPAPSTTSIDTPAPDPGEGVTLPVETITFVYTWVSELDEESLPSPPSTALDVEEGATVSVSFVDSPPSGTRIDRLRVYRSATSALGATEFYFLTELNIATSEYVYDAETDPLQELLPSSNYDPPVDGLQGFTPMQAGMIAAFKGKSLYFCEPYRPHAWPQAYELLTDYDIVGLVAFGPVLGILTTGNPYIAQGTAPENMVMERVEQNAPCVSRDGIVDLGYAAAYPSVDGLVLLSQGGTELRTGALFSRTQWRSMQPETISAGNRNGAYVFTWEPEGGGDRETGIISLGAEAAYVRATAGATRFKFDMPTGNLYYIDGSSTIWEFASATADYQEVDWLSAEAHLPTLTSFGVLLVEGEALEDPSEFSAIVYRNGVEHHTITALNEVRRVPPGLGNRWDVKVKGAVEISRLTLAGTVEEIFG